MANTDRRMPDVRYKMFFPKSIDGGARDDSFFGGFKIGVIMAILLGNGLNILYCVDNFIMSIPMKILCITLGLFVSQLVFRYVVLNEKYYYNLYVRMKSSKVVKPSAFWGIVSFEDTMEDCCVTFQDLKVGVFAKLHRDSITGRQLDIKEVHYDAISDFHLKLNKYDLVLKKLDLMEPVGNDPRLMELDKLINNCGDNENLRDLVSMQVAHTKYLTRVNMYESEYVLIYSANPSTRGDKLIQYVEEALQELLAGCYSGYTILDRAEIEDLAEEYYGVKLFDSNRATVDLFKRSGRYKKALNIVAVGYKDGRIEEVESTVNKQVQLNKPVSQADKGTHKRKKGKESLNPIPTESIENQIVSMGEDETLIDSEEGVRVDLEDEDDFMDDIEIEIDTEREDG